MSADMPTGSSHSSFAMAALVAAGGVYGYAKSGSKPSLVAGLALGSLFGLGGYLIANGNPQLGHDVSLVTSVALGGAMGARYRKSGKVMPAGLLTALGGLSTAYHLKKSLEWRGVIG